MIDEGTGFNVLVQFFLAMKSVTASKHNGSNLFCMLFINVYGVNKALWYNAHFTSDHKSI